METVVVHASVFMRIMRESELESFASSLALQLLLSSMAREQVAALCFFLRRAIGFKAELPPFCNPSLPRLSFHCYVSNSSLLS